jgi:hypothetical protein
MASKFCSECGAQLVNSSLFCVRCGTKASSPSQISESSKPSRDQLEKVEASEFSNNENFSNVIVTRRTSNLSKVSLILLLIITILGATLFLMAPNSSKEINANSMKASQIMNFLVDKGYCSQELKLDYSAGLSDDSFSLTQKLAYKNDLIRVCELSATKYVENTKIKSILAASPPLMLDITVGDARFLSNLPGDKTIINDVDSVVGANWEISFNTNEARFPGVFEDAKRFMLEIAMFLKGETAKNIQPSDRCILEADNFKNSTEALYEFEIDAYKDCAKYFPASLDLEYLPDWID